jgi:hypothetical protein
MVGVDHVTFAELVDGVSDDLVLASPMSDRLHSLIAGIHLRPVANTNVVTKADQYGLAFQIHHLPIDCWMKMLSMLLLRGRFLCLILDLHGTIADVAGSGYSRCYGQYRLCRFWRCSYLP